MNTVKWILIAFVATFVAVSQCWAINNLAFDLNLVGGETRVTFPDVDALFDINDTSALASAITSALVRAGGNAGDLGFIFKPKPGQVAPPSGGSPLQFDMAWFPGLNTPLLKFSQEQIQAGEATVYSIVCRRSVSVRFEIRVIPDGLTGVEITPQSSGVVITSLAYTNAGVFERTLDSGSLPFPVDPDNIAYHPNGEGYLVVLPNSNGLGSHVGIRNTADGGSFIHITPQQDGRFAVAPAWGPNGEMNWFDQFDQNGMVAVQSMRRDPTTQIILGTISLEAAPPTTSTTSTPPTTSTTTLPKTTVPPMFAKTPLRKGLKIITGERLYQNGKNELVRELSNGPMVIASNIIAVEANPNNGKLLIVKSNELSEINADGSNRRELIAPNSKGKIELRMGAQEVVQVGELLDTVLQPNGLDAVLLARVNGVKELVSFDTSRKIATRLTNGLGTDHPNMALVRTRVSAQTKAKWLTEQVQRKINKVLKTLKMAR